jgi:adenine-specific DNA-methyltransferase
VLTVPEQFAVSNTITFHNGDCMDLLRSMQNNCADLVVTSPPYNLGKEYESRLDLERYLEQQERVINECTRVLSRTGSLCWQVGNYVTKGAIIPLDSILDPLFVGAGLRMRNRIVWHLGHGLQREPLFGGRYEALVWFTEGDEHLLELDPAGTPQD